MLQEAQETSARAHAGGTCAPIAPRTVHLPGPGGLDVRFTTAVEMALATRPPRTHGAELSARPRRASRLARLALPTLLATPPVSSVCISICAEVYVAVTAVHRRRGQQRAGAQSRVLAVTTIYITTYTSVESRVYVEIGEIADSVYDTGRTLIRLYDTVCKVRLVTGQSANS